MNSVVLCVGEVHARTSREACSKELITAFDVRERPVSNEVFVSFPFNHFKSRVAKQGEYGLCVFHFFFRTGGLTINPRKWFT